MFNAFLSPKRQFFYLPKLFTQFCIHYFQPEYHAKFTLFDHLFRYVEDEVLRMEHPEIAYTYVQFNVRYCLIERVRIDVKQTKHVMNIRIMKDTK